MSTTGTLDLCLVEATVPIRQAARHVISQSDCEGELKEELKQWLSGLSEEGGVGGGRENKKQDSPEYFNAEASIAFDLVVKIHQQLKANPLGWLTQMPSSRYV